AGSGDLLGGAEHRSRQLRMRLGGLRRQDDVGALAGESASDRQADAAAGSRDEHGPAPKWHGVPPVVVGERALSTSVAKSTASGRAPVRGAPWGQSLPDGGELLIESAPHGH